MIATDFVHPWLEKPKNVSKSDHIPSNRDIEERALLDTGQGELCNLLDMTVSSSDLGAYGRFAHDVRHFKTLYYCLYNIYKHRMHDFKNICVPLCSHSLIFFSLLFARALQLPSLDDGARQ